MSALSRPDGLKPHCMRFVLPPDPRVIPVQARVDRFEAADITAPQSVMARTITAQQFSGIFDTGASMTSVSSRVVSSLGLRPLDRISVGTAVGVVERPVYLVNLAMDDNRIFIPGLPVVECTMSNYDLLIGLDVIGCGDFIISQRHGFLVVEFNIYDPVYSSNP